MRKNKENTFEYTDDIKSNINNYLHKHASARNHKKYYAVYINNNGKYKKVKFPCIDDEPEAASESEAMEQMISDASSKKTKKLDKKAKKAASKAALAARKADLKLRAAKWKHHHGDRIDGRRLKTIEGMHRAMPYIMQERSDACNTFADTFDITEADRFCRKKTKEGLKNFSMLYVFLAAYVRVVSQRPGVNRFISGQEVYSRYTIDINMAIKKTLSLNAKETMVKAVFEPTDTINDVYRKFNKVVENALGDDNDFDSFADVLLKIPRPIMKSFIWFMNKADYHGALPLSILEISPFHGSMIITSMGSLGIKPIYHHLYNFGNLPVFISYGMKRAKTIIREDGTPERRKLMDLKVVSDERICDGHYYASAFKLLKKYVENPEILETPPETVYEDID